MTIERYHRCEHCGTQYLYQASGHGAGEFNHAHWCPDCYRDVRETLKKRPRVYECRYRNLSAYPRMAEAIPLDRILAWERQNEADRAARGEILAKRIWPGLINVTTGISQNVREVVGRDEFAGVRFKLATWGDDIREYTIEVPMEWDVQRACFTNHPWPVGSRGFRKPQEEVERETAWSRVLADDSTPQE